MAPENINGVQGKGRNKVKKEKEPSRGFRIQLRQMDETILLTELFDAIKRDDVVSVSNLQSNNLELFELATRTWGETPLHVACKHGSCRAAGKIAEGNLEYAKMENGDGYTPLHISSAKHDLATVDVLVGLDSGLCSVKDKHSMIPLQAAIVNGHGDVIRALIAAYPRSVLKETSKRETVLHLAANHYQVNAFEVLLKEIIRLKQKQLLQRKDRQGNNILHTATANKLVEIVKLLLPGSSTGSVGRPLVPVNLRNKRGLTALDIYNEYSGEIASREIGKTLHEAGALEGRSLAVKDPLKWPLDMRNVLLVVSGIVTGATFTIVCNLPSSFLDKNVVGAKFRPEDIMAGLLPPVLYLMVLNTSMYLVCLGAILVLLWSFPFRPVVLFATITLGIVYALLVGNIMPEFSVKLGSHNISSFPLSWLLAIAFIISGALAYYIAAALCSFAKAIVSKARKGVSTLIF